MHFSNSHGIIKHMLPGNHTQLAQCVLIKFLNLPEFRSLRKVSKNLFCKSVSGISLSIVLTYFEHDHKNVVLVFV